MLILLSSPYMLVFAMIVCVVHMSKWCWCRWCWWGL